MREFLQFTHSKILLIIRYIQYILITQQLNPQGFSKQKFWHKKWNNIYSRIKPGAIFSSLKLFKPRKKKDHEGSSCNHWFAFQTRVSIKLNAFEPKKKKEKKRKEQTKTFWYRVWISATFTLDETLSNSYFVSIFIFVFKEQVC